jgi:hypothetical protein
LNESGTSQRLKTGYLEKKSIEPFLRIRLIVVFLRDFYNKLVVFDTFFSQNNKFSWIAFYTMGQKCEILAKNYFVQK